VSFARRTIGALFAAAALGAVAQELPLRDPAADTIDFDDKLAPESKARLPAFPKPENLIRFDMGPARRGFEHFIDSGSLAVGEDGVVRYTLVVRSDMGAENVSYEGIRCVTREHKIYAHGRRDGSWRERRDAEWKPIGQAHSEGATFVLYEDFFCPMRGTVRSPSDAIAALKRGAHPRASDEATIHTTPLGR